MKATKNEKIDTREKVAEQTRLSKPRSGLKPRPTIGQSPAHATQADDRAAPHSADE